MVPMTDAPAHQTCLVASHLFLLRGCQVLLARRFQTGYEDGNYSVPAGHVDEGEPGTTAMIREAKEEVGIVLPPHALIIAHVMHRDTTVGPWFNLFFTCDWDPAFGEPSNQEPDKCDELRWADMDDLPHNVVPYVRTALTAVRRGEPYSEHGWP
jgi:8-oxo-dGTP diphosphatase